MARRWPLHPIPYKAEALSSWLGRIAEAYDLHLRDLFVQGLGIPPVSARDLDLNPPEALFRHLEERTGVAADRVKRMTTRALTMRFTRDPNSWRKIFSRYAGRYSLLLPPTLGSPEDTDEGWRPWISIDRFNEPWVCERCLAGGKKPHLKLQWKLPIALSCPEHRVFLKPIGFVGAIDLRPLTRQQRIPPDYILELDAATEEAMLGNDIKLSTACIPADSWFPLLRSLLSELNVRAARAGTHHHLLCDIWSRCNLKPRAGAPQGISFEEMSPDHQGCFLEAAALAMDLLTNRKLCGEGRDAVS
jgi:hypothetical protein